MTEYTRDLVDLLTVRADGDDGFIGDTEPYGVPGRLFGGHFIAQALSAAFATVRQDKLAHSLHAYFHVTGDSTRPVHYEVETLRDGRSFSARSIRARQDGELVFSMSASFKLRNADEHHQRPMPQVPAPETVAAARAAAGLPPVMGPPSAGGRIEMLPLTNAFKLSAELAPGESRSERIHNWLRMPRAEVMSERQQQMMLGFASDGPLPFCSAILHGEPRGTHQHLSLDHSVWFHRMGDIRDWTLFDACSVATADGRGLNDGHLFAANGDLLVSIRQESLLRRLRA